MLLEKDEFAERHASACVADRPTKSKLILLSLPSLTHEEVTAMQMFAAKKTAEKEVRSASSSHQN